MIPRSYEIRYIALLIAFFQSMLLMAGYLIGQFLVNLFGTLTSIAGAILLVWIGVRLIKETAHPSYLFFRRNMLLVYLGIGVENFLAGVSVGTTKSGWMLLFATFILVCFGASFLALFIGKTFRRNMRVPVGQITGLILIVIGVKNFIESF